MWALFLFLFWNSYHLCLSFLCLSFSTCLTVHSGRRLSAHRLLKVRRVAHFLVDKLHLVVVIDRGESDFVDLKDSGGKGDGLRTDNKDKSNINNGNSNNGSSSAKNKDDDAVYHDCGDSTTMNGASVTGDGEKAVDALLTPEDAILFSCRTHEVCGSACFRPVRYRWTGEFSKLLLSVEVC